MSIADSIDLVDFLVFVAGFLLGGVAMVYLVTSPHPAKLELPGIEAMAGVGLAIMIGMMASANFAALVGRTLIAPLMLGIIFGGICVIRMALAF
ncbi:MAG: hypothetical protein C5B60_07490 [Chloroflexi bacterium]|nr:MAG: hypothetical protein C5B60_07490 [Chloroflexota bacterium]